MYSNDLTTCALFRKISTILHDGITCCCFDMSAFRCCVVALAGEDLLELFEFPIEFSGIKTTPRGWSALNMAFICALKIRSFTFWTRCPARIFMGEERRRNNSSCCTRLNSLRRSNLCLRSEQYGTIHSVLVHFCA